MKKYAIFGNPIEHSLSPKIHNLFSKQTGLKYSYKKICPSIKEFNSFFLKFFSSGGIGANITIPFKEKAFFLCNKLTKRAQKANSVNSIYKNNDIILGDNTDGIGLITDLNRLNYINTNSKVLLIGAGGAAKGVIDPILKFGCKLTITNRTIDRAKKIASRFKKKSIKILKFSELNDSNFNLIINATSVGILKKTLPLNPNLISKTVFCYDMFYNRLNETSFISWCKMHGAIYCSDGLGMLVSQAAHSFLLWYGFLPNIIPIILTLRST